MTSKPGEQIRTLHVLYGADQRLGGAVQSVLGVCRHLNEAGHVAEILSTSGPGDQVEHLRVTHPDVACTLVPRTFPGRYWNSRHLRVWMEQRRDAYALVEIHGIWTFATVRAARCCQRLGWPYFVRPHGSLDPFDYKKHGWMKRAAWPWFFHPVLSGAQRVLFTSDQESQRAITCGTAIRGEVVPLPVTPAATGSRGRFREAHGIPGDATVLLFLSRFDYGKGIEVLVHAAKGLMQDRPGLWLVLAGGGTPEYGRFVSDFVRRYGIPSRTVMPGFVAGSQKADVFAGGDIFALLSERENFGIAIMEAMQAALPVVITECLPFADVIRAGDAGAVCSDQVDDVREALRRLVDNPALRARQAAKAASLVRERFGAAAATERLVDTYRLALAEWALSRADRR